MSFPDQALPDSGELFSSSSGVIITGGLTPAFEGLGQAEASLQLKFSRLHTEHLELQSSPDSSTHALALRILRQVHSGCCIMMLIELYSVWQIKELGDS